MSETSPSDTGALFEGGPFPHFQRSLGLFRPVGVNTSLRATLVLLTGWVPLAVLVVAQGLARRNHTAASFFLDFAVHARSLIAAPLFILAESVCLPRLEKIARHFLDAGLVTEHDRVRFDAARASTRRLINSTTAEIFAIILAYAIIAGLLRYLPPGTLPAWYSQSGYLDFSLAGWWHAVVSLPLLLILFLGWLWRVFLWARFLWAMSRLNLQLIPAHPDLTGGLKFVGNALYAFMPVSFTLGVLAAGSVANRVFHDRASLLERKNIIIGLVIFVLILFVGPLIVFFIKLRREKRRGIFEYGALTQAMGRQFERKWLNRDQAINAEVLEAPDFSATTDLYQIVSNVYEMKNFPFGLKSLGGLIVATLLPFLPVALAAIPLEVILKDIAKLLL